MDTTGLIIVAAVLLVAAALGLWRRATDGRVRAVNGGAAGAAIPGDVAGDLRLVVQFSSEVCAPCRGVRRVVADVVGAREDIRAIELDVAGHPGLAERFNVMRTPTVLVLDADRTPRFRASGPLTRADLSDAIARACLVPQEQQ
ncbi:thioredoxin family protein [Tessaracoccus palaemonis]|uniref:Thioredoxin family protein n=1 Tax=Tessaracoccus palaemonis TaxID=2829499 RepID=A0ABX8SNG7_9ACTN|nr:thioredoxin family protein [Tessaracoccus palaemonis]QXT63962.1 thioredoxin family protein [Tessaracoccus palaemonis]